ncbi:MAG: response regulator transcription factor [Trueperaceae bacterium]
MTTEEATGARGGAGGRLLVVEDDMQLSAMLREQLAIAGYLVEVAGTLADARGAMAEALFDLVVLDLQLPDGDGLTLAEEIRRDDEVAVLILSARADVESRVAGLYAGASDYVTKPFSVQELLARIHVRLRERGQAETLRYRDLELDPRTGRCDVGDQNVLLPEREAAVLALLLRYRGRVFSQADLERALYGADVPESNTIEVFVYNLRRKLAGLGHRDVIRTVRNRGYVIL